MRPFKSVGSTQGVIVSKSEQMARERGSWICGWSPEIYMLALGGAQ